MKKNFFLILIVNFILLKFGIAQIPQNLIPNHSFEYGPGGPGYKRILGQIDNWDEAYPSTVYSNLQKQFGGLADKYSTLWLGWENIGGNYHFADKRTYPVPTSRFIQVLDGVKTKLADGSSLKRNKSYLLRWKVRLNSGEVNINRQRYSFNVHFSQNNDWRDDRGGNGYIKLKKAISLGKNYPASACVTNYTDFGIDCGNWHVIQNKFTVPNDAIYDDYNLTHIIIEPNKDDNGNFNDVMLDDIELFEYCPSLMVREERDYYLGKELEEASVIIAGNELGNKPVILHQKQTVSAEHGLLDDANGVPSWQMTYWPIITYKASEMVNLKPGFSVERSAEFNALIAPCGEPCQPPTCHLPRVINVCDENCVIIGCLPQTGYSYSWSSLPENATQFLNLTDISNPLFCPPQTGNGTFKYKLKITNQCGQISEREIIVNYTKTPNNNPSLTISDINLDFEPTFNITVGNEAEEVTVDLEDCNGNILKNYIFKRGLDFDCCLLPFSYLGDIPDPCGCYKFRVKTKNYCSNVWTERIVNWDNSSIPFSFNFNNWVGCDGILRLETKGVRSVSVSLFNRWGQPILEKENILNSGNHVFNFNVREMYNNLSTGTYFYIFTFVGCDGQIRTFNGSFYYACNEFGMSGELENEIVYMNEMGILDSVQMTMSPNPATTNLSINTHIPVNGNLKITIKNSNFETVKIVNNSLNLIKGDHVFTSEISSIPVGLYYCLLEFTDGNRESVIIRNLSILH